MFYNTFSLVLLLALWSATVHCQSCRRAGGTNCATANGHCSLVYNKKTDAISSLTWPPENNRTCYRTCYVGSTCKTHFLHQRSIAVEETHDASQYIVRTISSPRFGRPYLRGTNCRFNLKCPAGQMMSYSVLEFDLQDKMNCSGTQPACVDWVEHTFPGLALNNKVCGTGEKGEVHTDGANKMLVEFVSNRDGLPFNGFKYLVTCIAPEFDNNAVRMGVVPATPAQRRAAQRCTSPSSIIRRQTYPQPSPSVSSLPYPSISSLQTSDYITLGFNSFTVHRGEYGVSTFRAVYLIVMNRFSTTTYNLNLGVRRRTPLRFYGYGTLAVHSTIAVFHQSGANPVFTPTSEEKVAIHQLETALDRALGNAGNYDVFDALDIVRPPNGPPGYIGLPGPPPTRPPVTRPPGGPQGLPGAPNSRLQRGRRGVNGTPGNIGPPRPINPATTLALRYGNACNGVLRAIACAYQHTVLRRNCN